MGVLDDTDVGSLNGGTLENKGYGYTSLLSDFFLNGTTVRASTAFTTNSLGILESKAINVSRYDFSGATLDYRGLITEAAATTLLEASEDFTDSKWIKTDLTVSANNAVAPDGNMTMDLLIPSVANSTNFVYNMSSITSGQKYVQSVFVNENDYDFVQITGSTGFGTTYANFDLINGTVGNTDGGLADIEDVGGGIYRLTYILTATSTTTGRMLMSVLNADTASRLPTFAGDGVSGVNFWGANLVNAPNVSSYMKSEAVAVTRAAETNTVPWSHGSEFSLIGEFVIPPLDGNGAQAAFRADAAGSFDNVIRIKQTTTQGQLQLQVRTGGVTIFEKTMGGFAVGSQVKFALLLEQGNISFIINGLIQTPDVDTGGALPIGIDAMGLGCAPNGTQQFGGPLDTINSYNTRLADSLGIGLTS